MALVVVDALVVALAPITNLGVFHADAPILLTNPHRRARLLRPW
jgi:hypothetical protein